jgi:cytochrome c peroxidase
MAFFARRSWAAGIGVTARVVVVSLVGLLAGPWMGDAAGARAAEDPVALEKLKALYRRPSKIPFPPQNPYSDIKAKLGEMLFFDPRVSGGGKVSCASCHTPALGWSDGLRVSIGVGDRPMTRRSQTLLDLAWSELLMWDGRAPNLEEQVLGPVLTPEIMNQSIKALVRAIGALPAYRRMFEEAFPGRAMSGDTIAEAVATYERTIVSNKAPFDRWIEGDEAAIDASAKHGFALFNGAANCAACHTGWRLTDDGFHDIGMPDGDRGRGEHVPGVEVLEHAFKTPTLRNIALRPPYMHDGSVATLEGVVRHYIDGFTTRPSLSPEIKTLALTPEDVGDLVAFMRTLTSVDDPVTIPVLPSKEEM